MRLYFGIILKFVKYRRVFSGNVNEYISSGAVLECFVHRRYSKQSLPPSVQFENILNETYLRTKILILSSLITFDQELESHWRNEIKS